MVHIADPDKLPTDLDPHCLERYGISGFSRTRVNLLRFLSDFYKICIKMHSLSRSVISDTFFTNIAFPFKAMEKQRKYLPVSSSYLGYCL